MGQNGMTTRDEVQFKLLTLRLKGAVFLIEETTSEILADPTLRGSLYLPILFLEANSQVQRAAELFEGHVPGSPMNKLASEVKRVEENLIVCVDAARRLDRYRLTPRGEGKWESQDGYTVEVKGGYVRLVGNLRARWTSIPGGLDAGPLLNEWAEKWGAQQAAQVRLHVTAGDGVSSLSGEPGSGHLVFEGPGHSLTVNRYGEPKASLYPRGAGLNPVIGEWKSGLDGDLSDVDRSTWALNKALDHLTEAEG